MKREKNQNKDEKGFEKQSWRRQLTDGTHPYVKLGKYLRKNLEKGLKVTTTSPGESFRSQP